MRCLKAPITSVSGILPGEFYSCVTRDGVIDFQDNGADILGVAHLDTVMENGPSFQGPYVRNAPQLDDRLGVWMLGHLLPSLGCPKFDILLTDNEECGRSTASLAEDMLPDRYNWIFEFDRSGTDVVMYDYDDLEMEDLLEQHGFKTGLGSYSDISDMEYLGVKGFNFGCGYHDQHSQDCWADLDETMTMATSFVEFAKALHGTRLSHTPRLGRMFPYSDFESSNETEMCACGCALEDWWCFCPVCGGNLWRGYDPELMEGPHEQTRF